MTPNDVVVERPNENLADRFGFFKILKLIEKHEEQEG
jgi:hypothetical protein